MVFITSVLVILEKGEPDIDFYFPRLFVELRPDWNVCCSGPIPPFVDPLLVSRHKMKGLTPQQR